MQKFSHGRSQWLMKRILLDSVYIYIYMQSHSSLFNFYLFIYLLLKHLFISMCQS